MKIHQQTLCLTLAIANSKTVAILQIVFLYSMQWLQWSQMGVITCNIFGVMYIFCNIHGKCVSTFKSHNRRLTIMFRDIVTRGFCKIQPSVTLDQDFWLVVRSWNFIFIVLDFSLTIRFCYHWPCCKGMC